MARGQTGKNNTHQRNKNTSRSKNVSSKTTHQFFDKLLKRLAKPLTEILLSKLTDQPVLKVKELDREFTRIRSIRKHLDYLAQVQLGGEKEQKLLVHLEFQAKNEKDMALRMLEYGIEIYRKYRQYPYQVVVYLGDEPLSMENCFKHYLGDVHLDYCVTLVDITDLDAEELLSLGEKSPEALLLVVLSLKKHDPLAPRVFEEVLRRLTAEDFELRSEYLLFLEVIAQKKGLLEVLQEVRQMFDVRLEDIPTIKKIKEEGKKEGVINSIVSLMRKKYGLSKEQEQEIKAVLKKHSVKRLNNLLELLLEPISLEEFLEKAKK